MVALKQNNRGILTGSKTRSGKVIYAVSDKECLLHLFDEQIDQVAENFTRLLGKPRHAKFKEVIFDELVYPEILDAPGNLLEYGLDNVMVYNDKRFNVPVPNAVKENFDFLSYLGDTADTFFDGPGGGFVLERYIHIVEKPIESVSGTISSKFDWTLNKIKFGISTTGLNQQVNLPEREDHLKGYVRLSDWQAFVMDLKEAYDNASAAVVLSGGTGVSAYSDIQQQLEDLLSSSFTKYFTKVKFGMRLSYVLKPGTESQEMKNIIDSLVDPDVTIGQPPEPADGGLQPFRVRELYVGAGIGAEYKTFYTIPLVEKEKSLTPAFGNNFLSAAEVLGGDPIPEKTRMLYDIYAKNTLKNHIYNSKEFSCLFNYSIPVKRILTMLSSYVGISTRTNYSLDTLLTSTKTVVSYIYKSSRFTSEDGLNSTDISNMSTDFPVAEEADISQIVSDMMLGFITKALLTAPLYVVKGVAEVADPNIAITKRIFDAIDTTTKIAIKFGLEAAKVTFDVAMDPFRLAIQTVKAEAEAAGATIADEDLPLGGKIPSFTDWWNSYPGDFGESDWPGGPGGLYGIPLPDPSIGIPPTIAKIMAPGISFSMMPSMVPFGVGFPPPFMFGPGVGPPMTPLAIPYLAFGLIKEGPDWTGVPGRKPKVCPDGTEAEKKKTPEEFDSD